MNGHVEQWRVSKAAVASQGGVVAAQHWRAAQAGAGMLARGGNAVDAAVACAFALAAVEPWMCGLGGNGYVVVWLARERRARVLDFQGTLPAAIDPAAYPLDPGVPASIMGFPGVAGNRNVEGYGAILVPGAVAGLARALERFGRLGLDTVLGPALALAERGLAVDWFGTLMIALGMPTLARDAAASAMYLRDGAPPQPEQVLPLGALPRTLRAIAESGPRVFYEGEIAASIARDLQAGGSRITGDDLAAYEVLEPAPLSGCHRGAEIHTAGPTSGGPRLLDMLAHVAQHLQPERGLCAHTWSTYAHGLERAWRRHHRRIGRAEAAGCTSHLSAVDAEGNMVALTYTLLGRFGSGVVLPATGILMNNAVAYFDPRPGYPTSIAGRKRINASNMCPTVVTRDGEARLALGASGANAIVPCVAQLTALMLDYGLPLEEAFDLPRLDVPDRGRVRADPRLGPEVLEVLGRDFELEVAQRLVFPKLYACPSGVAREPTSGLCRGISDPSLPPGGAAAAAPFELRGDQAPSGSPPVTAQ